MRLLPFSIVIMTLACLPLAACDGKRDDTSLSRLDAKLSDNSADPVMRDALEAPIASDPDLVAEANRDALRPADKPLGGAVPVHLSSPDAKKIALKIAGGRLLSTPAASRNITSTKQPLTLGGIARHKMLQGECQSASIQYAVEWAGQMPPALPLYPGSNVTEAAGVNNISCPVRAVSFTTSAKMQEVMDFYYTMARRSGRSVEHVEENGNQMLSGSGHNSQSAYYISFEPTEGGGTAVNLITNGKR